MDALLSYAIAVLVSLFIVLDSIGNAPLFSSMLSKYKKNDRLKIMRKAVLVGLAALLAFSIFGNMLFQYLGVQLYSLQIAGGLLLFVIAFEMLFGLRTKTEHSENELEIAKEREDIAISPIAIPLLAGPGALSTGIVLFGNALHQSGAGLIAQYSAAFFISAILAFAASHIVLQRTDSIMQKLGPDGNKVLGRIMGLVLAAVAVQLVANGAGAWVGTL